MKIPNVKKSVELWKQRYSAINKKNLKRKTTSNLIRGSKMKLDNMRKHAKNSLSNQKGGGMSQQPVKLVSPSAMISEQAKSEIKRTENPKSLHSEKELQPVVSPSSSSYKNKRKTQNKPSTTPRKKKQNNHRHRRKDIFS